MIPEIHQFFSNLSYVVSIRHPQELAILLALGVLTEIGFPLLFTLEIFLLFASYYLGPLSVQVLLIIGMILLGRESGATILFLISRALGEPFLNWLQNHFVKMFRGMEQVRERARRHTTLMVIAVRLTPGFLQVPTVVSGSLHLKYRSFVLGVAAASLIYDLSLVLFGFIASLAFKDTPQHLKDYFIIAFGVAILLMWVGLYFRFRRHFDERKPGIGTNQR